MDVSRVVELLRCRIGLDPNALGPGVVTRAVESRMAALGIGREDASRYEALLDGGGGEVEALFEEVVVPESWFFRDELPFSLLAERLGATSVVRASCARVLSAPCARGEEPYSAAMALLDHGLPPDRFRVLGVDLSRDALARAEAGVYSPNSFRSRDLGFRARYFQATPAGFALDPAVKALVRFRQANFIDPDFLTDEPRFDAIFCRNLLIYLDEPSRRRTLDHLDRLLAPAGLLFVGHAEHLGALSGAFRPAGPSYFFAFERRPSRSVASARPAVPAPAGPAAGSVRRRVERPAPAPASSGAAARVEAGAEPSLGPNGGPPVLADAVRLADAGRHDEAAGACEEVLRRAGPRPEVYFLLGVVRQALGQRDRAEACFEKAVYLDPHHDDALLALAACAQRRGDRDAAANYLRRAGRAAERSARP